MEKIFLNDLLQMDEQTLGNVKIRLCSQPSQIKNHENPLNVYRKNPSETIGWLLNDNKNMFPEKSIKRGNYIVIGLLKLEDDKWLLFHICKIIKKLDVKNENGLIFEYESLTEYEKYFGRVIIDFHRTQAYVALRGNNISRLKVHAILSDQFDDDIFPGYENVDLSWDDLKRIVKKDQWKTALENQKGVYLITDTKTNKRYVGSAYGKNMILGRWKDYAKTGHGDNTDLKILSSDYIKNNFRYSILDIYKSTIDDSTIISREHWWMKILLTKIKEFGYNN